MVSNVSDLLRLSHISDTVDHGSNNDYCICMDHEYFRVIDQLGCIEVVNQLVYITLPNPCSKTYAMHAWKTYIPVGITYHSHMQHMCVHW